MTEEIEANQFAAELLMPTPAILSRMGAIELDFASVNQTLDTAMDRRLNKIAREFGVSRRAFDIRLSNLLV